MAKTADLFTVRKGLDEICSVPDKIISVYALEQHVWADGNSEAAVKARRPELQTIEEFQIDPVRPFLNDIFRNMAAPYKLERKENPVGQGYWIQAEFGSGKSHLLCFLAALALGSKQAWELVQEKEKKSGRGRRESLYHFWEEGLEAKNSAARKGVFVIVKTLVGTGGGTVGLDDAGRKLADYVLEAAKEQLQRELGKNISLYPAELLADRFVTEDLERYRADLRKFLRDPRFFSEDEFEDIDDFIQVIQQNKSPEYKRSCGNKLWRFYTEYLKVQPQIAAESEDILKYMVETIMAEGYAGVLLVLDEISLFMKNRNDEQRYDDEKTLVVLANRLAKVHNLPIWTVCTAQQAIQSRMGAMNIIADDRLKLVKLLESEKDYYDIVLARVRAIKDPGAIGNYYLHYKRGFTWPNSIGEEEFKRFFPFHKPALEVLRAVTYELTTTRSAIHFMYQTLKHQIKTQGRELIRLWELFDEAVRYEEDPSGVHAGLVAIKIKREAEYRAYEVCRLQVDSLTKGPLKVHRDKAIKILQTLFLYHLARTRQQGITPEEIANSVLLERDAEGNPDENNQHYETLAEHLKRELRQIVQAFDDDKRPRYRFDPVITGTDPRREFQKAREEAEGNQAMRRDAWEHLLALDNWPVRTRQMTLDLSSGVKSLFRNIAPFAIPGDERVWSRTNDQTIDVNWQGRQVFGLVGMRDLAKVAAGDAPLPAIESDATDLDFAVFVGARPVPATTVANILSQRKDRRVILWTPEELTHDEHERLLDFAAYRKLVRDWQGKETEDAVAVINWAAQALQTDLGKIAKIVDNSYARGRMDAPDNTAMDYHVAGELAGILTPVVGRVLSATYASRDIKFEGPFVFRKEEAVKVINGIVKTGSIPKGAKPNQDVSAAQNFGYGLRIVRKGADKQLDTTDNRYVSDLWSFVDEKLAEGQAMKIETLYKNFMGTGGPRDYGLSRRLVQLYLLCLVHEGKVRVGVGQKSGLGVPVIDYSTIAGIDFSAKVLDALAEVQKMSRPKNWDVLLPYAEKLLGERIEPTHDDAAITEYRTKLRDLFAKQRDEAARTAGKAKKLFEALRVANPYAAELDQVAKLFAVDVAGDNDIAMLLYGLKDAFGYKAFDDEAVSPAEVDDLAIRWKAYYDVQQFLRYETDLLAARSYRDAALPQIPQLKGVRKLLQPVTDKLRNLRPYIDSDVKLKSDLIGHIPPMSGETGTIGALIHEYTSVYQTLHDNVLGQLDASRKEIERLIIGDELRALKVLEGITALQPAASGQVERALQALAGGVFTCPSASPHSIRQQLLGGPVHECGLSFENADEPLKAATAKVRTAKCQLDAALDQKLAVFLNEAVRERLRQGASHPAISELLERSSLAEIRSHLVKVALEDRTLVETINRFLKKIVVKTVKIADFKPSTSTVEKGQVADLAKEFQRFLEDQFQSIAAERDTLPMLQVE